MQTIILVRVNPNWRTGCSTRITHHKNSAGCCSNMFKHAFATSPHAPRSSLSSGSTPTAKPRGAPSRPTPPCLRRTSQNGLAATFFATTSWAADGGGCSRKLVEPCEAGVGKRCVVLVVACLDLWLVRGGVLVSSLTAAWWVISLSMDAM